MPAPALAQGRGERGEKKFYKLALRTLCLRARSRVGSGNDTPYFSLLTLHVQSC